jgi:hypothetical protein
MNKQCAPERGKTYLTIGQDLFSINEYVQAQYNYSLHQGSTKPMSAFAPAAVMVYTDMEHLNGLDQPIDYGSGVEYADGILNSLFNGVEVGLQIGIWLNGTYGCQQIINGDLDRNIASFRKYIEQIQTPAVFIRLGYEFDNPFFGYNRPDLYIQAYQKIVLYMRKTLSRSASARTKFVWHSWAAPRSNGFELNDFYPGDDFVDWIGVSIFQQVFPWASDLFQNNMDYGGTISDIEEVLVFARNHNKPTMIAESTAYGGIVLNSSRVVEYNETNPWSRWFEKVLDIIETHDISMWSYINCNWKAQPMWHTSSFGDTRLSTDRSVMKLWHDTIIQNNNTDDGRVRFLLAGSLHGCGHTSPAKRFSLELCTLAFILSMIGLFKVFQKHRKMHVEIGSAERFPLRSYRSP